MSAGEGGEIAEEVAAKAVQKRYDGLVMVKNKAVKGKGAWYWAHLEPLLVHTSDTGIPKAVKLKCCLCETIFSASNPSRTASEHLKRGTCPHFSSIVGSSPGPGPRPTSATTTTGVVADVVVEVGSHTLVGGGGASIVTPPPPKYNHRKRSSSASSTVGGTSGGVGDGGVLVCGEGTHNNMTTNTNADTGVAYVTPISVAVDPSRFSAEMGLTGGTLVVHSQNSPPNIQHLSSPTSTGGAGEVKGREDLSNCVKKLKVPEASPSPGPPTLSKSQIECALDYLSDWVYESCGSVSFSCLEHPKFKYFLYQVGITEVSKEFFGSRLDSKFEEVKNESDSRIRDANFFQIASHGWKSKIDGFDDILVSLSANLPNGNSVYRRAVFTSGQMSSKLAEEVLCETIADICGNSLHLCVGIVSDKFKSSVLKNLGSRYHWMINLSCQFQAFNSLIEDFYQELPLFKNVAETCIKLADLFRNKTLINCFQKYQSGDYTLGGLLRLPIKDQEISGFEPVYAMIDDLMSSARILQLVLLDESYKIASMEDPIMRAFGDMIRDVRFWNDLEAVRSLVRLVKETADEFETERPLVGQCLPLWEDLKKRVKDWCAKYHIADVLVDKVIETRFKKNYHPAWAAAYILDPFYMTRDTNGRYLPPFKYLTLEQQKDVHDLITRLVSREEIPIAMSELMRWRSDGLDPVYAQAVQLKQRDPNTGKMRIANPQGSRLVWDTYLPEFQSLGKVALRVIFLHATARGFKCNRSFLNWVKNHGRSRIALDKAQKMIYIAAHSKLERRDFTSEDDKDAELFASVNGVDNVLNEVFVDP